MIGLCLFIKIHSAIHKMPALHVDTTMDTLKFRDWHFNICLCTEVHCRCVCEAFIFSNVWGFTFTSNYIIYRVAPFAYIWIVYGTIHKSESFDAICHNVSRQKLFQGGPEYTIYIFNHCLLIAWWTAAVVLSSNKCNLKSTARKNTKRIDCYNNTSLRMSTTRRSVLVHSIMRATAEQQQTPSFSWGRGFILEIYKV